MSLFWDSTIETGDSIQGVLLPVCWEVFVTVMPLTGFCSTAGSASAVNLERCWEPGWVPPPVCSALFHASSLCGRVLSVCG